MMLVGISLQRLQLVSVVIMQKIGFWLGYDSEGKGVLQRHVLSQ